MQLIERHDALGQFERLVLAASSGHGRVVLVKGAIAAGKSTLLHTFGRRGRELGASTLAATASRAEQDLQLGVLSQLIHSAAFAGDERAPIASLTAAAIGGTAEPRSGSERTLVDLHVLDSMCAALVDLSADRPLVISVDDFEHADVASRRVLLFLARRVHFARIALVLSHTDPSGSAEHTPTADLARQPYCHTINLAPLSRTGVRDLACELVGRAKGEHLYLPWLQLSGGNPLLVAALADDYRDRLRTSENEPTAAPLAAARYRQAVLACLHRAGERVLGVARGLAVLGGEGCLKDEECLKDLVGLPGDHLARILHSLTVAGIIAGGTFRHETARSAVLGDMTARERMDMHRTAAEITHGRGLPTGVVAEHLRHAGRITDVWAVEALEDAAARALCEGEAERAIAYLRQARSDCVDERRRHELTIKLVRAEWRLNPAVPVHRLAELTEATRGGMMCGAPAVALVRALLWHGRFDDARGVLNVVLEADLEPGTTHELVVLRDWLRCTYPLVVDPRLRDLPDGQDHGASTSVAGLLRLDAARLLSDVLADGDHAALTARAEQILRGCRPDDTSFDAIVWSLHALTYGDCLERAESWGQSVTAAVPAQHAPGWLARLSGIRGEIAVRRGDLPAAEQHARTALALVPSSGWGVAIGEPLSTLILASTAMGKHEAAAEQLGLPVPEAMFETRFGLQYLRARGRYSLATGNPVLALRDFRLCGELMREWRMDTPAFLPWRTDAAEAWLAMGQRDEARSLIEAQLARCGSAAPRAEGRTVRLLAAASEPHQRPVLLHRATELLQAGGDRYETALALHDLANAYRALGACRRAASIARRARRMAPETGAEPPPSEPETDSSDDVARSAALSDAERRVAALAALGISNREIAEKLWITVSTVEQHLTKAYRKLAVTRRSDLPAGLRAFG